MRRAEGFAVRELEGGPSGPQVAGLGVEDDDGFFGGVLGERRSFDADYLGGFEVYLR